MCFTPIRIIFFAFSQSLFWMIKQLFNKLGKPPGKPRAGPSTHLLKSYEAKLKERESQSNPFERLSLKQEFPGLPSHTSQSVLKKPETRLTELSNGLKVTSEEIFQPISVVSLFMGTGSRFENPENQGVSHLLEKFLLPSTTKTSRDEMIKKIEGIGASVQCAAQREVVSYTTFCLQDDLPEVMEILHNSIFENKYLEEELQGAKGIVEHELSQLPENPQTLIFEHLHAAAYPSSSIGQSLLPTQEQLQKLDAKTCKDFVSGEYTGNRMVLAGVGVEHDSLVKLSEKFFSSISAKPVTPQSPAVYVGTELRVEETLRENEAPSQKNGMPHCSHFVLAFHSPSLISDDLHSSCVLSSLLGGGSSFSAGGPGKGMYSRLYTRVMNRYDFIQSCNCFNLSYSDTGLFGVHVTADRDQMHRVAEIVCTELSALFGPESLAGLTNEEVQRAKNQLKSAVLMNLEMRNVLVEDLGRQTLLYGHKIQPEVHSKKIDSVTREQVIDIAKNIFSSKPSVVVYGIPESIGLFNQYDPIVNYFHQFKQ